MCVYDASQDVSSAPPAQKPADTKQSRGPAGPPGTAQLVQQHPPGLGQCAGEEASLAAAAGVLIRSIGGLTVAAPTGVGEIPAILGFIGSAIAVGAAAAKLANCRDEAAAIAGAK